MENQSQSELGAADKKREEEEAEQLELEENEPLDYSKVDVTPARKKPRDYRSGSNFLSRLLFMYACLSTFIAY